MIAEERTSTFWTTGRIIGTVVVAALAATVGYTVLSGVFEVHSEYGVALPGTPAPAEVKVLPDFDVRTLDGGSIKLSDLRGKVLVIDFWATWCPPCRKEVPHLARLEEAHRDRGLKVLGLHIDDRGRSSSEMIREFAQQYGINYTVGLASDEMFTQYLGRENTAIPQTLVFGRDGKQVVHLISYSDFQARALDAAVNKALAAN